MWSESKKANTVKEIKRYLKDQWPSTKWKLVYADVKDISNVATLLFDSRSGLRLDFQCNKRSKRWTCKVLSRSLQYVPTVPLSESPSEFCDWESAADDALSQAMVTLELETERSLKILKLLLDSQQIQAERRL